MIMNKKRVLTLMVAACMVVAGFLTIIPMGKSWATQNASTTSTQPTALAVGAKLPFTFTNDTKIAIFTCILGNASPAVGEQYNLSLWAGNGTRVSASVYQTQSYSSSGNTWMVKSQIGSTITTSLPLVVVNAPSNVENASMIITVVTQVTVCIEIDSVSWDNGVTGPVSYESWGGSILISETSGYQKTIAPASPVSTGYTFSNINASALYTPGVGTVSYAQEFNVTTTGMYLILANATNATVGGTCNFNVDVLEKAAGIPNLFTSNVAGIYQSILSGAVNFGAGYAGVVGIKTPSMILPNYALKSGQTYVLYITGAVGELLYANLTMITPTAGSLGAISVDLSTVTPVYIPQAGINGWVTFVTLPALQYDTVYSTSLTAAAWPWTVIAGGMFTLSSEDMNINAATNMKAANGTFLVTQDMAPAMTVDGQAVPMANPEFTLQDQYIWDNTTSLPSPMWSTGSVSDYIWSAPYETIFAMNATGSNLGASNPGAVTLNINTNTTNVAALPGTQSTTDTAYTSNTFTYQNDGSQDMMGLYKVTGEKGKMMQVQVTGFNGLNQVGVSTTNEFDINFFTGARFYQGVPGSYSEFGVVMSGGLSSLSSINNKTDGTGYVWGIGDSAKIQEAALFADPTYVIVISGYSDFGQLIPYDNNTYTPAGRLWSNSSSISLNWTFAPFLSSGDPFVVSRDSPLVVYDVNLPVAAEATLSVVYGVCSSTSITATVYPSPIDASWVGHLSAAVTYSAPTITATTNGQAFTLVGGFHAYLVLTPNSGFARGSVLKVTISSIVPIDWLAWGLFIAAIVALVIVAIVLSRKK